MNKRWSPLIALVGLAALLEPRPAPAWDSRVQETSHVPPILVSPLDAVPEAIFPELSLNGGVRYDYRIFQQALGGSALDGSESTVHPGLYLCEPDALEGQTQADLSNCKPLRGTIDTAEDLNWLRVRRGASGPRAEHYLIAREAAELAGLLGGTTIFERFWLTYPANNRVVVSGRIKSDSKLFEQTSSGGFQQVPNGDQVIVGQSWQPAPFETATARVTRGVSLLELAELPDFSHSLEDWAGGNETCPIPGAENAYKGNAAVETCHDFAHLMGSINATHFNPLNRQIYLYYHQQALDRMAECATMAGLTAYLDDFEHLNDSDSHPGDSELHVCEREAMAYEMFAQHFLQDAWASGHMWNRWGYGTFLEFPFTLPGEDPADVPEDNIPPRRALIAALTAAFSGMVHGAKAVVEKVAREKFGPSITDQLLGIGAFDDPLNGPQFTDPGFYPLSWILGAAPRLNVKWRPVSGTPDGFNSLGDLFWLPDPFNVNAPALNSLEFRRVYCS